MIVWVEGMGVPFLPLTSFFSQLLSLGWVTQRGCGSGRDGPADTDTCRLLSKPGAQHQYAPCAVHDGGDGEEMDTTLSPGAQSLMDLVQFQQKVGPSLVKSAVTNTSQ